MSLPIINLTGKRFARWLVLKRSSSKRTGGTLWSCRCDCGTKKDVSSIALRQGLSTSCGCYHRETASVLATRLMTKHGHAAGGVCSATYYTWCSMKARCINPNLSEWMDYGGRGITVSNRWRGKHGFENFLADMGERPEGRTLDRIDVNGNYEPGNCRWATATEQRLNQRRCLPNIEDELAIF